MIIKTWLKLSLIISMLLLAACHHGDKQTPELYTVSLQEPDAPLSYSGSVEPLSVVNIVSPTTGTIASQNVRFGENVKQNDILLTISSDKYAADYQNALLSYLKAKDEYANAKQKFNGTTDLWQNGLIAKNDYDSQKAALANSYAMLLQQQANFKKFLPPNTAIDETLSLENQSALRKLMMESDRKMPIAAPISGILLAPLKSSGSEDSAPITSDSLNVGTQVKEGQAILAIADLTGLKLHLDVNQMDINKLQPGLPVTVSSEAFSETLNGEVDSISIQAKSGNSNASSQPTFPITVVVKKLPPNALKDIRVGMNAKVTIHLAKSPAIMIPLTAVNHTAKGDFVINAHHKLIAVKVEKTIMDNVIISNGLTPGEQIFVPYPAS